MTVTWRRGLQELDRQRRTLEASLAAVVNTAARRACPEDGHGVSAWLGEGVDQLFERRSRRIRTHRRTAARHSRMRRATSHRRRRCRPGLRVGSCPTQPALRRSTRRVHPRPAGTRQRFPSPISGSASSAASCSSIPMADSKIRRRIKPRARLPFIRRMGRCICTVSGGTASVAAEMRLDFGPVLSGRVPHGLASTSSASTAPAPIRR